MAEQKWPERIGYRWTDENTDTPYSLTFDNPQSAIAFIISQRNNLDSADDLLAALFDADTGLSLAAEEAPTTADDVVAVAPAGVTLPEATTDEEDTAPEPVSADTTATASPAAAGVTATPTVPAVPAELPAPAVPTDTGTQVPDAPFTGVTNADPTTGPDGTTATPTPSDTDTDISPVSDTPTVPPLASSDPISPVDDTATVTPVTDAAPDTEDEDTDFDSAESDRVEDDGPVSGDDAPSIGTPTTASPGVTGV